LFEIQQDITHPAGKYFMGFKGGDCVFEEIADLLTDDNELAGKINFQLTEGQIFDRDVKDVTVFYKLVGDSRFKFFRSNGFELVFVHLTEDWMRQARVDLGSINYAGGVDVQLAWNDKEDILSVKGIGDTDYVTVKAMQIDN